MIDFFIKRKLRKINKERIYIFKKLKMLACHRFDYKLSDKSISCIDREMEYYEDKLQMLTNKMNELLKNISYEKFKKLKNELDLK